MKKIAALALASFLCATTALGQDALYKINGLTVTTNFTATGLVTNASLATAATNTIKGNATSGSASPTDLAAPSGGTNGCSGAGDAAKWTTNTGWGCNTSITAATLSAVLGPALGGSGVVNNAAATVTSSGNFAYTRTLTGATNVTFPTTGTLATLAGAEELTSKTLNASVGKGTWTASGTWTLPAFTLGGAISGGGNNVDNVVIGSVTPLAGSFTTLTASGLISNTVAVGAGQNISTSGATPLSVASGGNATIVSGITSSRYYLIAVSEVSATGAQAMYLCGNAACGNVFGTQGTGWVNPTTTPGAGTFAVAWDGGTNYKVYNAHASTLSVQAFVVKMN